jgi:hypothetical protein
MARQRRTRSYPAWRCGVCRRRLERLSGASWKPCPAHPNAAPKAGG